MKKLRTPIEYVISAYRALDLPDVKPDVAVWSNMYLGEFFWGAPLPNGWGDSALDWVGGEALVRRADWAWELAGNSAAPAPEDVADRTLGELLSTPTKAMVASAATRRESLALLLASPEFMRR